MGTNYEKIFLQKCISLIELSVVILVIGILVIGITQGSRIFSQAKIKSARSLTNASPVASVDGLIFWLDATGENSFDAGEQNDGSVITNWYDSNPQSTIKNNFSGSGASRPIYNGKCINDLPCVSFNNANYLSITNSNTNNLSSQLTMFIVVRLNSLAPSGNCDSLVTTNGLWASSGSMHSQICGDGQLGFGISNRNPQDVWSVTNTRYTANKTYVIGFVDNSSTVTVFVNGVNDMTTTQNITVAGNSRINDVKIGGAFDGSSMITTKYLDGKIGEIIVFNRGLKNSDRAAITSYLGKKWGVVTP